MAEKITKAVTPDLLNRYVTEQIKPYVDRGDSEVSANLDEAKAELSDEIASIKARSSEYEAKVDSEIVDLGITDDALRNGINQVSEKAESTETRATYNTRNINAMKAKSDFDYSGVMSTFCSLLRYAFDGSSIIENMKPESEFLDRGWFTTQDKFIEYNFSADMETDADSMFDLTTTSDIFDGRAKDVPGMSKVTSANYMFWAQDLMTEVPYMNLSSLTSAGAMFGYCSSLKSIPSGLDTSKVTNMNYMFYTCSSLTESPDIPMDSCVSAAYMYADCVSLRVGRIMSISADTEYSWASVYSPVTTLQGAFSGCSSLESVHDIHYMKTKLANTSLMFNGCARLKSIPYFCVNTYSGSDSGEPALTTIQGMFQNCSSLKGTSYVNQDGTSYDTILNTSNVTDMSYLFNGCSSLDVVPPFNCESCVDFSYAFKGCASLEWVRLRNIKSSLDISASTKFTRERLVELIGNLQTVEEPQTLTMGPDNLAKLTEDEIAVANGKNWTLA